MRKRSLIRCFTVFPWIAFVLTGCTAMEGEVTEVHEPRSAGAQAGEAIPGHYIVVLRDDIATKAARSLEERVGDFGLGDRVKRVFSVIPAFAARLSPAELARLQRAPTVAHIEPDRVMSIDGTRKVEADGVDRIDQRALPCNGDFNDNGLTGKNVNLYIVDTGIRKTHREFGDRVSKGFTAIVKTDDLGACAAADAVGDCDCQGHGSHVASTAAGAAYGVAPQARLHPVRVLDCYGGGTTSGVIAGVDFVAADCARQPGPCVANMSLGGARSEGLNQAIQRAVAAGISFAVAAGNSNTNACQTSPASAETAIAVAATDDHDRRASFSNFGECVDIFAPGVTIKGASAVSDTSTMELSGTSMASPHVAGAIALHLEKNPTATPTDIRNALENSATIDCVDDPKGPWNRLLYADLSAGAFSCSALNPNTCEGHCDGQSAGDCWCDTMCENYGDCCSDYRPICVDNTCQNNCNKQAPGGCWCDSLCAHFGDCCTDKRDMCGS